MVRGIGLGGVRLIGHSLVSESYKASSGLALERTKLLSPSHSDLGIEEAFTCRKQE